MDATNNTWQRFSQGRKKKDKGWAQERRGCVIESLAEFCEDLCIEIYVEVPFCVVLCVSAWSNYFFGEFWEHLSWELCATQAGAFFCFFGRWWWWWCTMDWGIWLIVAFFAVGFTIVALLWWIRFPKAASIVMRGQHVIITGGSSGIGLALAQLVAAEGAAVISLIARDPEKLAAAQASVQEYCKQKHSGTYHRPQIPLEVSDKPKP